MPAVSGSFLDLTEVGRRFERGDRPGGPFSRRTAAGECCTVGRSWLRWARIPAMTSPVRRPA